MIASLLGSFVGSVSEWNPHKLTNFPIAGLNIPLVLFSKVEASWIILIISLLFIYIDLSFAIAWLMSLIIPGFHGWRSWWSLFNSLIILLLKFYS